MFLPLPLPNGGWSSYKGGSQLLFSLRIKAPFTGCYLLRTGILCWEFPPPWGMGMIPQPQGYG